MKKFFIFFILWGAVIFSSASTLYPSEYFDLSNYKLQYPGPSEQTDLSNFTSQYFYSLKPKTMTFFINASSTGHTVNSDYVRSELRHLSNWYVSESAEIQATLRVDSKLTPSKITVMQIHGETKTLANAPPLLRIAVNNGSLYAFIKSSTSDSNSEKILLENDVNNNQITCKINIFNDILSIWVNGKLCVQKKISYWGYLNYFKVGAYPQAHEGWAKVTVYDLTADVY